MLFSKPFHLLVAILFLFQAVLPAHLPAAAAPVPTDQAAAEEQPDNLLSSLYAETAVLANISVEMKALLGELHERYPEQFSLWQSLLTTLQDSDPRKQELAEKAGATETFLSLLMGYSTSFDTLQQQLLAQLEDNGTPESEIDQAVVSLYTILQYQEKVSAYELLAQGQIQDIHLLARTISVTDEQKQINEAIEAFETHRRQIIKQVTTVRQEFEQVQSGFADLNQAEEETIFAPIRQESAAYQELAERLAAGQQQDSAGAGRDFLAQLEQIAANRQRDMEATLAAMSDGREGTSWPLFYQPGTEQKSSVPSDWSFTPERLLSVMAEMRTAFIELADILQQRNTLLLDSALLQRDELFWLAAHIELENLRLERLAEIIAATGKPAPQGDRDAYHQSMIQWEEFGLLKEDILGMEVLILNELNASLADETLADGESWQSVAALLQRQIDWRSDWIPIATSFAQVVEGFKSFQAELLQEKLQAIETLRADIVRSHQRLANQPDSPLAPFLTLIDEALAEQLEATNVYSDLKAKTQQREQVDPLFSSFFGIRSDRFFNDFKYMGAGLWGHAALTNNLARSRAHLLALNSSTTTQHRQALLMLQLADQLGVIDTIDYDAASCTVHLRSTSHSMVLDGCGREAPPELRSAAFDQTVPHLLTASSLIRSLFSFASPAHALSFKDIADQANQIGESPSEAVRRMSTMDHEKGVAARIVKQARSSFWNYALFAVVAGVAIVATPVAIAAGATAATVTTIAAGAATVLEATKVATINQMWADAAVTTSHVAIDQMDFSGSKHSWLNNDYFHEKIDTLETCYNVAKIVEAGHNLWTTTGGAGNDVFTTLGTFPNANSVDNSIAEKRPSEGSIIEVLAVAAENSFANMTNLGRSFQGAVLAATPPVGAPPAPKQNHVVPTGNDAPVTTGHANNASQQQLTKITLAPPPDSWSYENDHISSILYGWHPPSATNMVEQERQKAAYIQDKLDQLYADEQRMRSAYQSSQTQNQQQSADAMAQIERDRSTQIGDAIFGGFTSGFAQGVDTFGSRLGQGAGARIAQDTGLVDRQPKSPAPGQNGGGEGQGQTAGDCPAGTAYDPASKTCVQQDNTAKSYRGSWRASSTCAANYGSRGSGTCTWNGSAQITLHPGGRVTGSITGGSRFTFNEGGNFSGCGGGSASHSISGSHSNGSISATASNGARISGRYTDAAITGSTRGSGTNALSGGHSMNCSTTGSISLSR